MRARDWGWCPTVALVLLSAALGCGGSARSGSPTPTPTPTPSPPPRLTVQSFVSGVSLPVGMQAARDGTGRLFVLEQAGKIRILRNGSLVATPFLDVSAKVADGGELGLLGIAFHPSYASNRKFYLNYTRQAAGGLETVIAEYLASAGNPDLADAPSERILLAQPQPFSNHNGGQLAFGADGYLYIGLGDGGSGGDPLRNGQNLQTLLGKFLRIDVNATSTGRAYAIPADNPFAAGGGAPEIFAYGFRNPWRFSFDAAGRLFVGDVGQGAREEIDLVQRGGNYGWNVMEGTLCFSPSSGCNMTGLALPIHDYGRDLGGTVIGGYVYRGTSITNLRGTYVFGDFLSGRVWGLQQDASGAWQRTELAATGKSISSFGEDESGELYLVDYSGVIWKLVAQ